MMGLQTATDIMPLIFPTLDSLQASIALMAHSFAVVGINFLSASKKANHKNLLTFIGVN